MVRALALFAALLALPVRAFAQAATSTNQFVLRLPNPFGCTTGALACVTDIIIAILWTVSVPVLVIVVILVGYQFLTAQGNEEKISQARKTLFYAVIGFGVILISGAISAMVRDLLGI